MYPNLTAQYFLSLDSSLTTNKTLTRHLYDVWGCGSHGTGSFGSYRALRHISPSSLGLSDYERLLWAGPRTVIAKSKGIVSETESISIRDKSSGRKDHEQKDEEGTIPIPETGGIMRDYYGPVSEPSLRLRTLCRGLGVFLREMKVPEEKMINKKTKKKLFRYLDLKGPFLVNVSTPYIALSTPIPAASSAPIPKFHSIEASPIIE
ncbi:hypothetical protein K435DRAFT_973167 [Dendrothele bispora CBS 962.96]|uniref:Uncharacterized protein n=1 Tax=Dendrothele bispora (strain CBS 962.96) TaxID=1314807 RepID=A0A4S8KU82_DENBC|nr:hypothetical protein K435DRAFT_973167 [Dendrothele bispora CBS 962.96]